MPNSIVFDGTGDYLRYPAMNIGSSGFTLVAIVKRLANSVWGSIISGETSGGAAKWALEINSNGRLNAGTNGGGTDAPTGGTYSILVADAWCMVVVTFAASPSTPNFYRGVFGGSLSGPGAGAASQSAPASTSGGYVQVGRWQTTDDLNGKAALLALFDGVVLSSTNVSDIWTAKTTQSIKDLGPARLYDASDDLTNDLSGNAAHRTSVNGNATTDADLPAGWTFGLAGAATPSLPIGRPAARGLVMR